MKKLLENYLPLISQLFLCAAISLVINPTIGIVFALIFIRAHQVERSHAKLLKMHVELIEIVQDIDLHLTRLYGMITGSCEKDIDERARLD